MRTKHVLQVMQENKLNAGKSYQVSGYTRIFWQLLWVHVCTNRWGYCCFAACRFTNGFLSALLYFSSKISKYSSELLWRCNWNAISSKASSNNNHILQAFRAWQTFNLPIITIKEEIAGINIFQFPNKDTG